MKTKFDIKNPYFLGVSPTSEWAMFRCHYIAGDQFPNLIAHTDQFRKASRIPVLYIIYDAT